MSLSVILWKWRDPRFRTVYTAEHVNRLAAAIGRHYAFPHRVILVSDDGAGVDSAIEVIPDRGSFADVASPHGRGFPSCYRRLLAFHPDAAQWFGERFVSLDLDSVILRDLAPVWNRDEDFVGYRDPYWQKQMNGSMFMLRAGSRPEVWTDFHPHISPRLAVTAGFKGSDQGWMSYRMPDETTWSMADGVYSYKFDIVRNNGGALPPDARIVFFTGDPKPWSDGAPAWARVV